MLHSIDQPVSDFYPEWKQGNKAKITIRMLLDHTSGLQNVPNTGVEIYPAPDGLKLALAAELSTPPGTAFSYNNKAMNLLAGIFEKAAGMPMDVYIAKQVLTPLGIKAAPWGERDHAGHPFAMAGWMATPEEAARVGELVLDGGRWNGHQLIDAAYMKQMTAQSQPYTKAYGLLWWRRAAELHLSAKGIDRLRALGTPPAVVDQLATMREQAFANGDAFSMMLHQRFGKDGDALMQSIREHHLSGNDIFDPAPIMAWEANGYLGNYIVIVPKAHLVAVRQIASRDDVPGDNWPYGYDDFTHRVVELARTYTPSLATDGP
ncbi:class A beta-lactamase-related serine hydrolase [Rhodanobacter glycinis]|uniref:Class A beta-lactamase-related serine hydrolase n=1 Tax=Rhodanobacter glycinis TaxID=582702 RepID=A0A502FMH8_9GAMM|nr:serine hydrolase domain-containing protein [Rhodanobacter glycinis]TPG04974.1 class A beta-lactamase-related serine hydrolase [Rhodanobacter glycinis]TPG50336.1 class A beta-lactamase-related serine hydrolase [Rhodanobacter glycinis]